MHTKEYYIDQLQMEVHPEGGYFKETYRSNDLITNKNGKKRATSTAIYFLNTSEHFSAFHRIQSDEMWHYHAGTAMSVYIIHANGELEIMKIGPDLTAGEQLQGLTKSGCWFASRVDVKDAYSLVGCTVSPGFDFEDLEMADRNSLLNTFPQHAQLIKELTR